MNIVEMITPYNVVKAAQFILELDQSMIDERHWPDLGAAIYWLKDSLDQYLNPQLEGWPYGRSPIEHTEYTLKLLLEAVKSIVPCLTEEAKHQLGQFLRAASPMPTMA